PDQMLYDKERIVVKAGKPFEILFENNDLMPHNLALLQPGALEEVGTLAETTATQPGALARDYVPNSPKILLTSRLLQPRESPRRPSPAPIRTFAPPLATGGECTGRFTSSPISMSTWPSRKATWPRTRCPLPMSCSSSRGRGRSGSSKS